MNFRRLSLAVGFACASLAGASLHSVAGEPKAIVELFTSQGCSSCPAADKLLGDLAHDPAIIALSLPVDYWDYLGWKDTLALHGHGLRQRAYSVARGDRAVYTPQAVINGVVHALGSDKAAIEDAVAKSLANKTALSLPVKINVADGKVIVDVPAGEDEGYTAEVWLCPVTDKIQVTIERGENRGQILNYYNVVRRWIRLGAWTGKSETYSIPLSEISNANYTLSDINRFAVLVQNGGATKPGRVVGAATAELK